MGPVAGTGCAGGPPPGPARKAKKDPADCLIGATALVEGLSLVTADKEILKSRAVPTIW